MPAKLAPRPHSPRLTDKVIGPQRLRTAMGLIAGLVMVAGCSAQPSSNSAPPGGSTAAAGASSGVGTTTSTGGSGAALSGAGGANTSLGGSAAAATAATMQTGGTAATASTGGSSAVAAVAGSASTTGGTTGIGGTSTAVDNLGGTGGMPGAAGATAMVSGGAAGAMGMGGSGGAASSGSCGEPTIIDDLEDGDDRTCAIEGRDGNWFIANDTMGTQMPATAAELIQMLDTPREASLYAAHTSGSGFTEWGAIMGLHLVWPDGAETQAAYDASAYTGVSFWARGSGEVFVGIATINTLPVERGGACVTDCDLDYRTGITLTATWTEYTLPFTGFANANAVALPTADLPVMTVVQFPTAPGTSFDFWVDDVRFY